VFRAVVLAVFEFFIERALKVVLYFGARSEGLHQKGKEE